MQDTAKTQRARQRKNTYIHTQTKTVCHVHMHAQTRTHKEKCAHSEVYWLNRKAQSYSVACKSISPPACFDGNKTLSCFWFRGFLHLVVAVEIEIDTP